MPRSNKWQKIFTTDERRNLNLLLSPLSKPNLLSKKKEAESQIELKNFESR